MTEIVDTKTLYATISNTDLTEGRGSSVLLAVSEIESTAIRLGHKRYVMGGDCPVEHITAYKINGSWCFAGVITKPSEDDIKQQAKIDLKKETITKAKLLGLSDDDIANLKQ